METSCGFILINYDSVLLLQYPQGHWSFPKGHVEDSDSDHFSTAPRELLEETGISKDSLIEGWCPRTDKRRKTKRGAESRREEEGSRKGRGKEERKRET